MAKPKARTSHYVPVDNWTLRCLFNRSDYDTRIASAAFVELHREQGKWRNGSRTVEVYYGVENTAGRWLMVRLQWFENEQLEILRSGRKDPKQLYQFGIDFHQHGGNTWWNRMRREPQTILGEANTATRQGRCLLRAQQAYGGWRTFKCRRIGATEASNQVIRYAMLRRIPPTAALAWLRSREP
jgi:hypothetical protein